MSAAEEIKVPNPIVADPSVAEGDPIHTDVVIIGAGPVGIFTVFELGLLNMKCHLIDNLDKIGGQCAELYPEKPIYDIPSRPTVDAQELVDETLLQAEPFEPVYHLNQQADHVERLDDGTFKLVTSVGTTFFCKVIVIAAGAGSFVPRRPPIQGIEEYEGTSVFYAVRKMKQFEGKKLLIAGGGDSALDWTNNLEPLAASTALVHRRDQFRAAPDSVAKMFELRDAGRVDFHMGNVVELHGTNGRLEAVTVKPTAEGEPFKVECDTLLPFFGLKMELGPLANWGLNLHENLIEVDTEKFETNEDRIFAVGDICWYPGKLKLILSGYHEAALMAQQAFRYCFPDQKLVFRYTTSSTDLQKKLGVK